MHTFPTPLPFLPAPPAQVWPKAVDCELFHPGRASQGMRARLAGGSPDGGPAPRLDGPLLLYVGRVSPEKNLALLRPLLEKVPGARLAVVGDGPAMQVRVGCYTAQPCHAAVPPCR